MCVVVLDEELIIFFERGCVYVVVAGVGWVYYRLELVVISSSQRTEFSSVNFYNV